MPNFRTPAPISVTFSVFAAQINIIASNRSDTVVDVQPADRMKAADVSAAEQTRVECSNGRLLIRSPRRHALFGAEKLGSVAVTVELPSASNIQGKIVMGEFRAEGPFGDCEIKGGASDVSIDRCRAVALQTGSGDVSINHIAAQSSVVTGTGLVRIGKIDGASSIKNSSGGVSIGEINGDLRVLAPNGELSIGRVIGSVVVKAANGSVRLEELVRGSVDLTTARGEIEIGISEGTAAWLDASTLFGSVLNSLSTEAAPQPHGNQAQARARTYYGSIVIRRAHKAQKAHR